jgi:leader peptidase (prepilin peptidase)/N-methyltransferase
LISPRYPIVEILSALLSWYTFYHFQALTPYLIYYLLLIAPLIIITFIDLEHRLIPDVITIPGIVAGALSQFVLMHGTWKSLSFNIIVGVIVGGGFLALVGFGYEWLKKQEGLGGGDVKLAAMLGAFFGWKGIIFILLISSLLGSFAGIILLVVFRKGLKYAIPYGPFLTAGALIYLFWGDVILNWYLNLM